MEISIKKSKATHWSRNFIINCPSQVRKATLLRLLSIWSSNLENLILGLLYSVKLRDTHKGWKRLERLKVSELWASMKGHFDFGVTQVENPCLLVYPNIMSVKEQPPQQPPKLVTLNKAFKLAEQWVGQMTGDEEEEAGEMEVEGRPSRLGLGATVPRNSEIRLSTDAVERRLQKKLGVGRKKFAGEGSTPSTKNEASGDSDDEENLDSRTSAFAKKRARLNTTPQPRKKKK